MLPIVGELTSSHCKEAGCEVFAAEPGEDQKTGIVHQQVKSTLALFWRPADEAVSRLGVTGGSPKAEKGNDAIVGTDEVAPSTEHFRLAMPGPVLVDSDRTPAASAQ
jgi:hypothetical protein